MNISSRTPEGEPNRCPVCGHAFRLEPSRPPGDAPCPSCGQLVWFGPKEGQPREAEPAQAEGDVRELIERAQRSSDQQELAEEVACLRESTFTLDDFKKMIGQATKLGPLNKIMSYIPGLGGMSKTLDQVDAEGDIKRIMGIIDSMTSDERCNPRRLINQSRRRRIAEGAGVRPHEVNELVKQFEPMAEMMRRMARMNMEDRMKAMQDWTDRRR